MRFPDQKTERISLDGTPNKRLFGSIMADYELKNSITELIDNSFDIWLRSDRQIDLEVSVRLDVDRQLVAIADNAGGVSEGDLQLLITPGGSSNDPDAETIGVFGVGSKRAAVAIAERIEIRTRRGDGRSFQIDITPSWLESPDWSIPAYEIPSIPVGRTVLEFSHLRRQITDNDIEEIRKHLGETYGLLLKLGRAKIKVNNIDILPVTFDNWCYPPNYEPKISWFEVQPDQDRASVVVGVEGGLIGDRDAPATNYGVYVYCNRRLIVKELRTRDVGYDVSTEAGRPHPDASLCRVIVQFEGPAILMPWNSSKTGVISSNPAFQLASPTIVQLCTYFSKISRATKGTWENTVFPHTEGAVVEIEPEMAGSHRRMILPPLPRVRRAAGEKLRERNEQVIQSAPYVVGLIEAIAGADIIMRQRLHTKGRIALVLLDSTFEIAIKEYLVHKRDLFNVRAVNNVLGNRTDCIKLLRSHVELPEYIFSRAEHYYEERNKLTHERATLQVTDPDIELYREAVTDLLTRLYSVIWPG